MPEIIQRSFTSGEIAPALRSRADMVKYATGLALCKNFFIRAQGGAYSRPGFRFIAEQDDHTKKGRLIPFSFNTEQTYILVFEHLKMRVIKNGGVVLAGGGPTEFELVTPYTEAQLYRLGYTQNADVMTIVHPDHDPANLNRLADDNWTLTAVVYTSTITPPVISLDDIGSGGGDFTKFYEYVVTAVVNGVESLPSTSELLETDSLSTTYGIQISWPSVADAEYYRIYKAVSVGSGNYGWIGESKGNSFDDFNLAPITSDAPPSDRDPFSGSGNKPSTVTYFQQRQVFANTINEPQSVFTTQTNVFNSLRTSNPARADDAITFTVAADQVNEIRHLISLDALLLLTSGSEFKVTEGQDQVLTPDTVGTRRQSANGASWVKPAVVNSTAIYVQEKGAKLRDFGYDYSVDKYTGNDLSLMSEHFFDGYTITDMTYAAEPYSILWCVRNDGVLLGLTYQREHQVYGWHQHDTQGTFESVATISEDGRDAVYVIVRRNINGVNKRYIERMESRSIKNAADSFCVDSGLSYTGPYEVSEISGLDHLEGETVSIVADGYVVPDQVVTSGSISLPRPALNVHVGLSYLPVIELLDIDVPSATETLKSQMKSVSRVIIEVEGSRGGWVGPTNIDDMKEIKPRFDSDNYGAITLKTYKQEIFIEPDWSRGGGVRIEQRSPLPMAILSVIPKFDVSD